MEIPPRALDHSALLDLILDSSPLGITVLTTDLRYVLVNRYAREELLRLPEEQVLGRHCYDIFGMHANDPSRSGLERACDACPSLRALSTGEPATNVRRVREGLVVQSTVVPLTDDTGDLIGVMAMIENIADKVSPHRGAQLPLLRRDDEAGGLPSSAVRYYPGPDRP